MRELEFSKVIVDPDGRTRFADVTTTLEETDFAPPAAPLDVSVLGPATAVSVIASDDDWGGEVFHRAPARQLMVVLRGRGRITTGSGESREFGPGDVVQVEDVTGAGHSSRFFGETVVLVVRLGGEDR